MKSVSFDMLTGLFHNIQLMRGYIYLNLPNLMERSTQYQGLQLTTVLSLTFVLHDLNCHLWVEAVILSRVKLVA